jgi:hypothetical protein
MRIEALRKLVGRATAEQLQATYTRIAERVQAEIDDGRRERWPGGMMFAIREACDNRSVAALAEIGGDNAPLVVGYVHSVLSDIIQQDQR